MLSKSIPKDVKIIIKEHKDIFNTSRKACTEVCFQEI